MIAFSCLKRTRQMRICFIETHNNPPSLSLYFLGYLKATAPLPINQIGQVCTFVTKATRLITTHYWPTSFHLGNIKAFMNIVLKRFLLMSCEYASQNVYLFMRVTRVAAGLTLTLGVQHKVLNRQALCEAHNNS